MGTPGNVPVKFFYHSTWIPHRESIQKDPVVQQWISLCRIPAKRTSRYTPTRSGDSLDIPAALLSFIRAFLGLLLIFFIPGFTFMWAIYPKKTDLTLVVRIALSCVLSVAIVMLSSLFLDFVLGIATTGLNVTIMLLIISLIFTILYTARIILDYYGMKNVRESEL